MYLGKVRAWDRGLTELKRNAPTVQMEGRIRTPSGLTFDVPVDLLAAGA